MAELRVERKRPNIWRWIVLLLVIALLTWALVEWYGGAEGEVIDSTPIGVLMGPGVDLLATRTLVT